MQSINLEQLKQLVIDKINDTTYHFVLFDNDNEANLVYKQLKADYIPWKPKFNSYTVIRIGGGTRRDIKLVKDIIKQDNLTNSILEYYNDIGDYDIDFEIYQYQSFIIKEL